MGFGARLVLGLFFVFFSSTNQLKAENASGAAASEAAVDELVEDIDRLGEYIPALGNAGLSEQLANAERLARRQDYVGAAAAVSDMKFRMIGISLEGFGYSKDLTRWSEFGFLPTVDDKRDLLHEAVMAMVHVRDAFNTEAANEAHRNSALVRFIALQNLVSALRLRQDSAAYALNSEVRELGHELFWQFLELDRQGNRVSESQIERVTQNTERLAQLTTRFTEQKRQESVSGAVLVLSQLKDLGPSPTGATVIRYEGLSDAIQAVERQQQETDESWKAAAASPYQTLFAEGTAFTDPACHFQVLKLELARRVLEQSQKSVGNLDTQLATLVRTSDPAKFWSQVEVIRAGLNQVSEKPTLSPMESGEDAKILSRLAPDVLQAKAQNLAGAYALMVDKLHQNFSNSSSTWQKMQPWAQSRSEKALKDISLALRMFSQRVAGLRTPEAVAEVAGSLHWIQLITNSAVEAAMLRSKTAPEYAALLSSVAMGFNGHGALVTQSHIKTLWRLVKVERREGIYRAWVNKDTITTAALSALLIGEAVSVVYTGGASAAAMPATLAAIKALSIAGRTVLWVSRGILAASGTSNLIDRYRVGGWMGLANMESALDALIVLSVLPRLPLVTPSSSMATSRIGKFGQWMVRKTAEVQFTTTRLMSQIMMAYSGYQVVFAESIAAEYQKMGVQITPGEVRARAALGLALSALVLYKDRQALLRARQSNPEAASQFEKGLSLSETRLSKRLKGMINPYAAARDFYRVRPSWYRAIGGAAVGLGYAGMDYLLINEGILLAHTNPDFNYMNQVEKNNPFPTLNEGESAMAMVGISPLDTLLYFGAHAKFSHKRERQLYGDKYFVDNYVSPEDLVKRLVRHAEQHGPIRYLKIMTHGRPGMLYSQAVDLIGSGDERAVSVDLQTFIGSGWIDRDWLEFKRAWIRAEARKAFAPDARIILWACLSGANFDEPKFGGTPEEPLKIGDQFLNALGNSFLPEGGSIDASTRILIGLGSVFGSALDEATYAGKKIDENYRPVVPVVPLEGPSVTAPAPTETPRKDDLQELAFRRLGPGFFEASLLVSGSSAMAPASDGAAPAAWDSLRYTAGRAQYMLTYMPQLWWKYGIMLEGPWWHQWYQHVEVPATND